MNDLKIQFKNKEELDEFKNELNYIRNKFIEIDEDIDDVLKEIKYIEQGYLSGLDKGFLSLKKKNKELKEELKNLEISSMFILNFIKTK